MLARFSDVDFATADSSPPLKQQPASDAFRMQKMTNRVANVSRSGVDFIGWKVDSRGAESGDDAVQSKLSGKVPQTAPDLSSNRGPIDKESRRTESNQGLLLTSITR